MGDDGVHVVAFFYGGNWRKKDDGRWVFENYRTEVVDIKETFTFKDLENEVYEILGIDRSKYFLRMKYQYSQTELPCDPQCVRRDRDVKNFIRVVKTFRPVTPLYVEVLPIVPNFSNVDLEKRSPIAAFNLDSGSNQKSSTGPTRQMVEDEMYRNLQHAENSTAVQHIQVPETQVPEVREVFNIYNGMNVCAGAYFPTNEEYNDMHDNGYDANLNVDENVHNEVHCGDDMHDNGNNANVNVDEINELQHTNSPLIPPRNMSRSYKSPMPPPLMVQSTHQSTNLNSEGRDSRSVPSASSRYLNIESGSSETELIELGYVYDDKQQLQNKLYLLAVEHNFQFKIVRSSPDRYEVRCLADGCGWKVRAKRIPRAEKLFRIKEVDLKHTCKYKNKRVDGDNRQANSRTIGQVIRSKYDGIARVYKPREIMHDINMRYGIKISYDKAWRARECALRSVRGSAEDSFALLPSYFAMLEKMNPGTVTRILTDDNNCFRYCFMALGGSIKGFASFIRPVVAVDGTTLKHKYSGYLYIASAVDGNGQIFPIAFGIGDGENEAAYTWFFQCFKECFGEIDNLVFVTDRHKGIENALKVVYPNNYHGLCMYHISQNLKAKKFAHNDVILPPFYLAAKAYLPNKFDHYMAEIEIISTRAFEYLQEIDGERWARSMFPVTRYNILTTNIAECMNAILKDAREMPIIPLLDNIRSKLQQWFHDRRTRAGNLTSELSEWAETKLSKRSEIASRMLVRPINPNQYRVVGSNQLEGMVDLANRTCTCKKFDLHQFPCVHAMAACMQRHIPFHAMTSPYYYAQTLCAAYAESIYPVGDIVQWDICPEVKNRIVLPPVLRRRSAGRPRKNRILSQGEDKIRYKCSRCHQLGHNRAKCKEPFDEDRNGGT